MPREYHHGSVQETGCGTGALYRIGHRPVIGVNALDASVRQRFTIVHELGHLRLHEETLFIDRRHKAAGPVIGPGQQHREYRRDQRSCQATDDREMEANAFAASLLMPRQFLAPQLARLVQPIKVRDIELLARQYGVSQQAMVFRALNLGFSVEEA